MANELQPLVETGVLNADDVKAIEAETDATKKAELAKTKIAGGLENIKKSHVERERENIKKEVEKTVQTGTHNAIQKTLKESFGVTDEDLKGFSDLKTADVIATAKSKAAKQLEEEIKKAKEQLPNDAKALADKITTLSTELESLKVKANGFEAEKKEAVDLAIAELSTTYKKETALQQAIAEVLPSLIDGFDGKKVMGIFKASANLQIKTIDGKEMVVVCGDDGKPLAKNSQTNYLSDIKGYLLDQLATFVKKSNGTPPPTPNPTPQNGGNGIAPMFKPV